MIGVNKFKPETLDDIGILKVDTSAVRARQIAKLERLKAARDAAQVQAALDALTAGAGGNANLLELAIAAARAKATVGEISFALEKVVRTLYIAGMATVSGVYAKEAGRTRWPSLRVKGLVQAFRENDGRAPKILVAKIGQDGHDRGQQVVASALADLGFDVIAGPLFATPEEAARQAAENNVHILGVSSLAAGHLTFMPQLRAALAREGRAGHHARGRRRDPAAGYSRIKGRRGCRDFSARNRDPGRGHAAYRRAER